MFGIMPQLIRNLIKANVYNRNGAPVSVTGPYTAIATSPIVTVSAGDRVLLQTDVRGTKLVTQDQFRTRVEPTGASTAVVNYMDQDMTGDPINQYYPELVVNEGLGILGLAFCEVVTGGTLALRLFGYTPSGTFDIAIGLGAIEVIILR